MRLGALPNGSWRILRAKYGANDEGFLVAVSGIHGFNSVGGDLGHVYVVAAQMSCGEVALLVSPPSSAGTTESTPVVENSQVRNR